MTTTTPPPRRYRRLAAAAVALALPAAAISVPGAHASDDGSTTLVVGKVGLNDIPHMNPLDSGWVVQGEFNNLMYDPLIRWGQEDYVPAPGLAESWEVSDDELTWTYHIDPDATWSDGQPVTANDAKFTFELLQTNELFNSRHGDLVDLMTSIEAPDEQTLVITTEEPNAILNHMNNIPIMPEHVWGEMENPDEYTGEPGQPTSGPFELAEYSPGQRVVLTANPDYWDGPVAYDELIFQSYETTEAAVQALQQGEIDFLDGLNPEQAGALEQNEDITVSVQPSRHLENISFNMGARTKDGQEFGDGHPALQDPAVRQAIHHVVDKQRLVDVILDGNGTPGVSWVAPIFTEHFWDPGEDAFEVSADAGNQLLDDAGYTERTDAGIRIDPESGEPLSFRLFYHSDRPTYADIQDFLVEWVAELDIELEPIPMETTPLNEETDAGNYDIAFGGWNYGPDPSQDLAYLTCDRLPDEPEPTDLTFDFYCNDEVDALWLQQLQATDPAERAEAVKEIQRIVYQDSPQIILYYDHAIEAYSNDWTGFGMLPSSGGAIAKQQAAYGYAQAVPADAADESSGDDEGDAAGDDGGAGADGDDAAASSDDDGGSNTGLIVGIVIAAVVVIGGVVFLMRRRSTAEERE
ncbi:ABC transporter substrate-binding protein [Phytoactinopolyspora halotolerans]|uniref:ABC transporter substrate-binding protein n=1 Tax=Phytoactinopolyspora halotolerans TaxID=1981512 RepID=A0A6L9S4W1_9ACTN|nr:ABC transporter substrate-binding protein [Phytoactinopolyspora halotolerans]NEE00013.1 ABC transporter substrate-binding protein [Phytoactinopolyspora halotolerans]